MTDRPDPDTLAHLMNALDAAQEVLHGGPVEEGAGGDIIDFDAIAEQTAEVLPKEMLAVSFWYGHNTGPDALSSLIIGEVRASEVMGGAFMLGALTYALWQGDLRKALERIRDGDTTTLTTVPALQGIAREALNPKADSQ